MTKRKTAPQEVETRQPAFLEPPPIEADEQTALAIVPSAPVANIEDYKAALAFEVDKTLAFKEYIKAHLQEDVHYGRVPGVKHPFLWKPGSEIVQKALRATAQMTQEEREFDASTGWIMFTYRCRWLGPDGNIIADFMGSCNSFEGKKLYRWQDRQKVRREPDDLAGEYHNIMAMAQKRAHTGAAIQAGALSDQFTIDGPVDPDGHPDAVKCPSCGKGFLVERNGKKGTFWGCDAYPRCKHTSNTAPVAPTVAPPAPPKGAAPTPAPSTLASDAAGRVAPKCPKCKVFCRPDGADWVCSRCKDIVGNPAVAAFVDGVKPAPPKPPVAFKYNADGEPVCPDHNGAMVTRTLESGSVFWVCRADGCENKTPY